VLKRKAELRSLMSVWQIPSSDSMEENKLRVERSFPTIQDVVGTHSHQQRSPVQLAVQGRVADGCEEATMTCVGGWDGIESKESPGSAYFGQMNERKN
jgi:hypothetical protein